MSSRPEFAPFAVTTLIVATAGPLNLSYGNGKVFLETVTLSSDRKTVLLGVPKIQPTWGMKILFQFAAEHGVPEIGVIHNTIHQLAD